MFRYLAFVSNGAPLRRHELGHALGISSTFDAAWRPALQGEQLCVFTTASTTASTTAFATIPLPGDRGTVLGRLFRRQPSEAPTSVSRLSLHDANEVMRSDGATLVSGFWGSYVAFLVDAQSRVSVLRDPGGALPCFYMPFGDLTIVCSWLEDVLSFLPNVPAPRVNGDALAAHLAFGELGGKETALAGVEQVRPGERVVLDAAPFRSTFLWKLEDQAAQQDCAPSRDQAPNLRRVVRDCTSAWASCYPALLLRLSGGVDSSILASCLGSGATDARVTCVNYHSPGADGDERAYARLAAAKAGLQLIERERDDCFKLERVFDVARTPAPVNYLGKMGSSALDAEIARSHGACALFTGAGGDQAFFEFRQWWPAADHLRHCGIGRGFLRASLDAARLSRMSFWRVLQLAFADRFRSQLPIPEIHAHWTLATQAVRDVATQQDRFMHPAVLGAEHLGIGKLHQVWNLAHSAGFYDVHHREAAPEMIHPLLSQPVVEFCLRTPSHVLTEGGRGRGLARRAFADDLPREVSTRRTKGAIDDHVGQVLARNVSFARETLLDGELVRMGLLDRVRVESALHGTAATLLGRSGEIHLYIGIEAWLRRWAVT